MVQILNFIRDIFLETVSAPPIQQTIQINFEHMKRSIVQALNTLDTEIAAMRQTSVSMGRTLKDLVTEVRQEQLRRTAEEPRCAP